jgi:hypothetical protein
MIRNAPGRSDESENKMKPAGLCMLRHGTVVAVDPGSESASVMFDDVLPGGTTLEGR